MGMRHGVGTDTGRAEAATTTSAAPRRWTVRRRFRRQRPWDPVALLREVGTLLADSPDYEATLARVARLAVPHLADWCLVHLVDADGTLRRLATAHGDPAREAIARVLQERYPDPSAVRERDTEGNAGMGGTHPARASRDGIGADWADADEGGVAQVVRTGRPLLFTCITDADRAARARDPEHLRLLRLLGSRSAMIVPLIARGRTLGALSFLSTRAGRHYRAAELDVAAAIADRAALAVDNARLYRDAHAALRARDEALAAIAHDVLQPLGVIRACTELLAGETTRPDAAEAAWLVDRIDAAAARAITLARELRDLDQTRGGQPPDLQRTAVDLVALVRHHADAYGRTSTLHSLHVVTDVPTLVGYWDGGRLERVVANLLTNAIRYSPDGGEIELHLTTERDGAGRAWAQLTVRDAGLGIPAADLPRVFERFYRGANVVGRIAGTGIGLAGVQGIVEQHGGTVMITSREGAGTAVTVRLPLHDQMADSSGPGEAHVPVPEHRGSGPAG